MANPAVPGQPAAPTPGVPGQPAQGQVHKPTAVPAQPQPTPGQAQAAPAAAPTNGQAEGEKPKRKAKAKTGVPRPRLAKFDENHVITVLRPNAKTRMSGDRYNQYQTGMTVKAYIDKMTGEPWKRTVGQVYADLRWDTDPNRKLINIGPEVVPIPEQPVKEPKAPKQAAPTPGQPA